MKDIRIKNKYRKGERPRRVTGKQKQQKTFAVKINERLTVYVKDEALIPMTLKKYTRHMNTIKITEVRYGK